jgi:hypothetical protein
VVQAPVRLVENFAPGRYTAVLGGGKAESFTVAEGRTTVVEFP